MSLKKKRSVKKTAKKKVIKRRPTKKVKENIVGVVTHYFSKVRAAVVKLKAPLEIGDTIKIKGHTTDFAQEVTSIQINHQPVKQAKKSQEIGLLVDSRVRQGDVVHNANKEKEMAV